MFGLFWKFDAGKPRSVSTYYVYSFLTSLFLSTVITVSISLYAQFSRSCHLSSAWRSLVTLFLLLLSSTLTLICGRASTRRISCIAEAVAGEAAAGPGPAWRSLVAASRAWRERARASAAGARPLVTTTVQAMRSYTCWGDVELVLLVAITAVCRMNLWPKTKAFASTHTEWFIHSV